MRERSPGGATPPEARQVIADGFESGDGIPLPFTHEHRSSRRDGSTAQGDIQQYARRFGSQPCAAEVATVTRDHDRFGGAATHSTATTAPGTVAVGAPGGET